MKTVIGLLERKLEARDACEELVNSGFSRDSIKIMASENSEREIMAQGETTQEYSTQEPFFKPGTGFGVLGRETTPLTGMGVLDEDASFYAERVNRGGFLVTVSCEDDRAQSAADILSRHGAIDVDEGLGSSQSRLEEERLERTPEATSLGSRESRIPVVEEEIQVGKREVQKGRVRVYNRITEVPVEEEIRLREEHAKVERRPVDQPLSGDVGDAFKERSFELRETAEEPVISKQAKVKEEVLVGTEATERTEVVRDTLRRTDVEVEKLDEGYGRQVADMGDDEFIAHFNATYGQSGERFEENYRSAYHFAESESTTRPQLMNKEWNDVEDEIHQDWERSHPGTWSKMQQAIQFGWDKITRHH